MPKRGGRGRGRGGKAQSGRGGHGRGGKGGGRGGGRQGYNVDYYGDQFEDDYMSFTGQHSRRSNAEEEVYRRIQMAKANNRNRNGSSNDNFNNFNNANNSNNNSRGGHHDRQSGFRPPPPKQGNNGKNSKHHFWPHPDSQTHSTAGQRAKAKINVNSAQIMFNRATSLTDPTAHRQLSQEYDLDHDDYDESEDEDSSDDLIHHGIDCSEDESDCELMQQFDWIEEEQDTPTPLSGHVVETSTVVTLSGPSYNDMESEIVSTSLDSSLAMGMAMTQSDDVRDIIETVRNMEIGADEISSPTSATTTTTTTTNQSSVTTVEIEDDGKTTVVKTDNSATTGQLSQPTEQDKPKKKKAHRSKRGGKNQRDKQIARQMVVGNDDDGPMFLEDDSSDEDEDEEILAMEDYLQNTMDGDPKQFETLLGALKALHAGHGHSKNLRGKNADDFDFEQPGSEDDSQDNDDDEDEDEFDFEEDYRDGGVKKLDFRKVSARARDTRKNRQVDDLLREALDEEEENLLPLWRSGAIGDGDGSNRRFKGRAKGYDFYDSDEEFKRGGANSPGSKKKNKSNFNKNNQLDGDFLSLLDINRSIEYFVKDRTTDTLQLQPMPKALRRRVHLLCNHYNLKSQSIGSGKRRFPVLIKTDRTKMPTNPANVNKLLNQGDNELAKLSAQFQGSRKGNGGNGGGNGYGGGKKSKGRGGISGAIVHGAVVGAEASEISTENLGHRMLSKMGWSPGVGLGASGEGITQPIEAIMRSNRRGLGHE
ncbi:hypothetical protein MVEG_09057 [Podila verticillata NRRL 6337]|nr:hypothetical protein MVEG_09057 [Podila verticillata NRRL 6337]